MKLSERLAAVESQEEAPARARRRPAPAGEAGEQPAERGPGAATGTGSGTRDDVTAQPGARRQPPARPQTPARPQARWQSSKRKVHELVLAEVAPSAARLAGADLEREVRKALDRILQREDLGVSPNERRRFVQELLQDVLGYGALDPLLADPEITEIMCNDYNEIWIERAGRISRADTAFSDNDQYRRVIDRIVSAVGRRVDEASPMVDARLPDGSRVNAIVPPLAIRGAVLTIRKFPNDPLTMADLINLGALSMDAAEFLEACVRGRVSLLVSGATSTGKTTFLNVLSSFIPDHERIITVEDAAELQLQQPHVINLEARPPNAEGAGEVRIRDLVKNCLRMRPDRIIVGECRGAEALDMLQAMHTGHEGSMTTVHANDPRDALSRLETMIMMAGFDLPLKAVRDQIASGLTLVVHLSRSPDGARQVAAVTEVQGLEGDVVLLQDVFRRPEDGAPLAPTGLRPRLLGLLARRGVQLPASLFRNDELLAAITAGVRDGRETPRPGRVAPPPLAELRRGGPR